jgi:hypothetical protein
MIFIDLLHVFPTVAEVLKILAISRVQKPSQALLLRFVPKCGGIHGKDMRSCCHRDRNGGSGGCLAMPFSVLGSGLRHTTRRRGDAPHA